VDALCGKPRILVDENLGEGVASFLRDQGCNVEFADDVGLAPAFPPVRSNISMAREAPQKAEKVLRWHMASSAAEPKVATGIAAPNSDIAIFKQHLLDEGLILGGGLNWSAQHSNLLAKMECGHETATSHLLLGSSTV